MENKRKVIIDFKQLEQKYVDLLNETYPTGFLGHTIRFPNTKGEIITAVRLETDDCIFLVKLSAQQKQVLTEAEMDEMIKPSEKDSEEVDDGGGGEDEEAEPAPGRGMDDDD